jgi:acyl carrier protein
VNEENGKKMHDIKTQVRTYIFDNFVMAGDPADLKDGDSFMEHHILDSTGFIELITFLEETFGIKVEDDEMIPENLDSLNNIERFLGRKKAAA